MMNIAKRSLSLILALFMCIGLFAGIQLPEVQAASYTYNWGARGDVADTTDFTKSTAEEWYSKYSTSYDELASLSGATSTSAVPSSALYKELKSLMTTAHSNQTSYDGTKSLYQYTDCQNGGGKISSFYSGNSIGPGWNEGGSWNREHTWPNSKGLGGKDETDIMMLRPTSTSENSSRGNTAYGESGSYYDPNGESGGKYNLHGDVARIWLYVYVRWGNTQYAWGTSGVMESKEVLLKWMEEDPVDTWELGRNDAVQSITGTRNVFVDYPELAFLMFNEDVPANYDSPSGEGNTTAYTVTAVSNNTSYGTVTCTGRTITATPKTGYYVQSYTVTSGKATVTQNGNTFNVQAESDCTVRINFAARTTAQVIYMQDGIQASTSTHYQGDTITIAGHTGTLPDGYSFVGWVKGELSETTTKPATIYAEGQSYTVSSSTDKFYALYGRVEGEGAGNTDEFKLFSGSFEPGIYLITYEGAAMRAEVISDRISFSSVTATNNVVTAPTQDLIWKIEKTSDGYYTIYNESTGTYAGGIGVKNKAGLLAAVDEYAKWTPSGSGAYEFVNLGQKNDSLNANLRKNGSYGFGCYSSSTGGALTLYKGVTGTMYYTTDANTCDHQDISNVAEKPATCTEPGMTAGTYCNDCGRYISGCQEIPATGHSWGGWVNETAATCTASGTQVRECSACGAQESQTVAALGHSYTSVVTPPTANAQGYTTHTCSRCGHSYVDSYVDAVGISVKVTFSVPEGVAAVAPMYCNKNGITLPTAGAPTGYTFLGWTTAKVADETTQPTTYEAGTIYNTETATTLYALYSYSVGGSGSSEYVLTDISQISSTDSVVVTMSLDSTVYALPNNGGATSPAATTVSASNGKLTAEPADTLLWNIETTDNGYIFRVAGGTGTLYCTSTNSGVKIGSNTNNVFIIDETSGYLKNTGVNRYVGVYTGKPDWRCYTSTTVNIGGQTLGFYVKGQAGTTYYTTLKAAEPVVAVYSGTTEIATYTSFEEALASYDVSSEYIKLLQDTTAEVILEDSVYIDLNGFTLEGILETDGYQVFGMDTTTDGYTCDQMGYFNCLNLDDEAVVPELLVSTGVTGAARRYLAIETENGYTFHRFYLGVTHISVKPSARGVGYKAVFAGDDMVKAQVDSFGYTLQVDGFDAVTRTMDGTSFVSGEAVTLRIQNYDAENFGETKLNANVFMVIGEQTVISTTVSCTLRQMVEQINATAGLTADKVAALAAWIAQSDVMQTWNVGNIYTEA